MLLDVKRGATTPLYRLPLDQSQPTTMRKIEQQMIAAIKAKRNWASGNTSVHYSEDYKSSTVYLHGNLIAIVYENDAELFDSGYQTVTTKSRLNAICQEFGIPGEGIFQKDFQWYVRKLIGHSPVTGKVFNADNWQTGYIFKFA